MKVLVVEDNDRLRKSIVEYLREEGFATDAAADGRDGLYKATHWDYDVLVLDLMLPHLDGLSLVKSLRQAGKNVPILMLTARTALEDRLRGLNTGADDYLTKPFEMEELVARLRALIRRRTGALNPVVDIGPITLNTASRSVAVDGKLVDLTAREYALFELLVLHRDKVVTRDFLYEKLFDERDETLSNMLDVYIYKLRQKLGRDLIHTRRGMGYQLCAG